MLDLSYLSEKIFSICTEEMFNDVALEVFRFQSERNIVYQEFIRRSDIHVASITEWRKIPFLPIQLFKTHPACCLPIDKQTLCFQSSGTTSTQRSRHYVPDIELYKRSLITTFKFFFGDPSTYTFIGLLPSYLEQKNASLVFMVDELMKHSRSPENAFHKQINDELIEKLVRLDGIRERKLILFGVPYALLDLVEKSRLNLKNTLIIETGGMKGRRKEYVREELHLLLCEGLGVERIVSEYGMTEMLSQAYSLGSGLFSTPPWLRVFMHDIHCPVDPVAPNQNGGVSIIDLANLYSCSFIHTQDIGIQNGKGQFEILGRFDNSDIRGCNLLYTQ